MKNFMISVIYYISVYNIHMFLIISAKNYKSYFFHNP